MDNFYLSGLVDESRSMLEGRALARIILSGQELLLDFRLPDERIARASLDPSSPAFYLSARPDRQHGSEQQAAHAFPQVLRKWLAGAKLLTIGKEPQDRIVRLDFERYDAKGDKLLASLLLALTGRSSNAYLLDERGRIEALFRERGSLQPGDNYVSGSDRLSADEIIARVDSSMTRGDILKLFFDGGSSFSPLIKKEFLARCAEASPSDAFLSIIRDLFGKDPVPLIYSRIPIEETGEELITLPSDLILSHIELSQAAGMHGYGYGSLSEAAEQYYINRQVALALKEEFNGLRRFISEEARKRAGLLKSLESDLTRFEDPDSLKRRGELLLANIATATIDEGIARVIDYYDPEQKEVAIDLRQKTTLQEAAADYFARYQKARRALTAISGRIELLRPQVEKLQAWIGRLDGARSADAIAEIKGLLDQEYGSPPGGGQLPGDRGKRKQPGTSFGRRFVSSDGYEIVVGKKDRDNDLITFRLARPNDVWLHAADYPGSHVIIRNPGREAVPHRAILEAAELAAFYSQARNESKAAVHHTLKKFVTKPPRSRPGLVRLSSFKTVMVEPRVVLEKLD